MQKKWGNIRKTQLFFVPLQRHFGESAIGYEEHEPINHLIF